MSKEVYIKLISDFLIYKVYPNISYNIRSILNIYDDLRFHTEILKFMDKDNKDISIELHIIQDYKDREDIDSKNIFDYKYQCYLKENSSYEELSKLSKLEDSKLNIKENHHSIRYFNDKELKLVNNIILYPLYKLYNNIPFMEFDSETNLSKIEDEDFIITCRKFYEGIDIQFKQDGMITRNIFRIEDGTSDRIKVHFNKYTTECIIDILLLNKNKEKIFNNSLKLFFCNDKNLELFKVFCKEYTKWIVKGD